MALLAAANEAKARRAIAMPDDKTAIRALTDAHSRLTELGWRQATYAPRGRALELIECGSSGIHRGERDEIGFWIHDGETWPSHPVLYRIASDSPAPSLEKAAVERPDGARWTLSSFFWLSLGAALGGLCGAIGTFMFLARLGPDPVGER